MDETCSFCSLNCGEFYLSVSTAEAFKAAEARDAGALSDRFSQQIRCNDSSLPSFTSWVVQTCAKGVCPASGRDPPSIRAADAHAHADRRILLMTSTELVLTGHFTGQSNNSLPAQTSLFNGSAVRWVKVEHTPYAAMRDIATAIGVSWRGEQSLEGCESEWLSRCNPATAENPSHMRQSHIFPPPRALPTPLSTHTAHTFSHTMLKRPV